MISKAKIQLFSGKKVFFLIFIHKIQKHIRHSYSRRTQDDLSESLRMLLVIKHCHITAKAGGKAVKDPARV